MTKNDWEHLQPLRIPGGWTVVFNKLKNLEPKELAEQDKRWIFSFTENILYMYTILSRKRNSKVEQQKLAIDLGWYPDGDPYGKFRLLAILDDNWEQPLLEFSSQSKEAVVRMIEQWLFQELCPCNLRFL